MLHQLYGAITELVEGMRDLGRSGKRLAGNLSAISERLEGVDPLDAAKALSGNGANATPALPNGHEATTAAPKRLTAGKARGK